MAAEDKKVKDIMALIDEYKTVDADTPLCNVLAILKKNHIESTTAGIGAYHKTIFVTNAAGDIIGKLSAFDVIRGLVPEHAKKTKISKTFYSVISSRALEVTQELNEFQERFKWLHNTFCDLVRQESNKKAKEIMAPVHPLLREDDSINKAVYVIFKENVRQPLVTRGEKIVGVVRILDIFGELLETADDVCSPE